jgi:hypothetical protein
MKKLSALFIALAFLASTTCIGLADTTTTNSQIKNTSTTKKHTPKNPKKTKKHPKKTTANTKPVPKGVKD